MTISRNLSSVFVAASVILSSLSLAPTDAHAKRKHVKEAIAAGIIGAAVGAALSHKHRHRNESYYPGYQPRYPDGGYNDYYSNTFSPGGGIICYRAQRICYDPNGTISHRTTFRIFGR